MNAQPRPMPALGFRTAVPGDVPALVDLVESAYRGDASRQGWTTEADMLEGQRTDAQSVRALIDKDGSRIVLGLRDGQLLACAHLERHDGDRCYFGMFSVRPDLQGGGIGRRLLDECERIARDEWGCATLDMTVIRQREELIAWYVRRGFRDTGTTKPFPYGDERFGLPKRDDLVFLVFEKPL